MWQIVDYYLILAVAVWIERKLLPGEEKAGRGEAKRRKAGCEKEGGGEAGYRKIGCGKAGMISCSLSSGVSARRRISYYLSGCGTGRRDCYRDRKSVESFD